MPTLIDECLMRRGQFLCTMNHCFDKTLLVAQIGVTLKMKYYSITTFRTFRSMLYSKYTRFIGNNLKLLYILMMNKKHRNQENKVTDVHFVSVMGNLL